MNSAHPEGEDLLSAARRRFLKLSVGVLAALNAVALGIPFIGSLVRAAVGRKAEWAKVGDIGSFPEGQPVEAKFLVLTEDAFHHEQALNSVWVIRHSKERMTVFSPVCTHLGCHFLWNPKIERFACPCHASLFSIEGKVLYGPAPRPLDTLEHKIENGVLFVKWQRFKVGIPSKVAV